MPPSPPPAHPANTARATSEELTRHVRAWRVRLNPDAIPDLPHHHWPHGRRRGVSQEQIAHLIGCSTQWYSRLELGRLQNYADDFLKAVARVLHLTANETRLLFLLVGKEPPTPPCQAAADSLQPVLRAQPFPAYLSDPAWGLVDYNEPMCALFPWVQQDDANVMRWVFTDPAARRRLHRWDTEWAPQMLAQIRAEQLRYSDDDRLHNLIREILEANPDARRLWQQPLAYFHPDGDRRSIFLPDSSEPYPIQIVALEPLRFPRHRLIMLTPAAP